MTITSNFSKIVDNGSGATHAQQCSAGWILITCLGVVHVTTTVGWTREREQSLRQRFHT